MKTLDQIISAVRDGERPDYDDLRYAICAMDALHTFDRNAFMKLSEAERLNKKPFMIYSAIWQFEELFNRHKAALGKPPKEYIGWNNDPDNPEFLLRRKQSVSMVSKLMDNNT